MKQEDKDLLVKDLCGRLPYGVKGRVSRSDNNNRKCEFVTTIDGKLYDRFAVAQESWYDNVTIKPYLFPMSSMTDEQLPYYITTLKYSEETRGMVETPKTFDWLNKNHFDYRGLIPMGLAIDATGLNIY